MIRCPYSDCFSYVHSLLAYTCCADMCLTQNSFVILEIQPKNCLQLGDSREMWKCDCKIEVPRLQVGSLHPDTGLLLQPLLRSGVDWTSKWWHSREKSIGQSTSHWLEQHIWTLVVFLLPLENTTINSTITNTSVRCCPCSSPVNDNPQGTMTIIRLGAIVYGSSSCLVSSSQTGFTILSYITSDLSLCSSDQLSGHFIIWMEMRALKKAQWGSKRGGSGGHKSHFPGNLSHVMNNCTTVKLVEVVVLHLNSVRDVTKL